MVDARDLDDDSIHQTRHLEGPRYQPPDWISTDELECELWNAIMEDGPGGSDEDIDNYDDSFCDTLDADDYDEDEEKLRRLTFSLLVGIRPLLGEVLGGPPAPEQMPR